MLMKRQQSYHKVKHKFIIDLISALKLIANRYLYRLSCCDLCGENTCSEEYFSRYDTALVCQYCLKNLPLFKQDIVNNNLLTWPAIHRTLPNIYFDRLFALSPYLPPFTHWLSQLKYQGRFEVADMFASMLSAQWLDNSCENKSELVLAVPLYLKKWQIRGYNQAHLIAKPFAKRLHLTYLPNGIIRIKNNLSQMGKTGAERRKNLKGAFQLNHDFTSIKHVLLVDDVVTTGTTASEISRLLKSAGVETVTVVTVCLTLSKL